MQRLLLVVILAGIVIGLSLFVLSDTAMFTASTEVLSREWAISISEAGNSSSSASITIAMTGVLDE